jgi:hypothetical protein
MVFAHGGQQRASVGDLRHDVALGRQELLERLQQQGVIVGENDTGFRQGAALYL